jgi:hypothetical protein
MSDIFREIDDDIRRDQAIDVWKKYSPLFLVVGVLIVAATGGYRFYTHYETQKAEALGTRFQSALEASAAGKADDAAKEFNAIASEGGIGYGLLVRFRLAAERSVMDKVDGTKQFELLASDASLPLVLRGLARLRAASLVADTASAEELLTRLQPLVVPGGTWAGNARELLGLKALKSGDIAGAGKLFDEIMTDTVAPATLKQRVQVYLALVKAGSKLP